MSFDWQSYIRIAEDIFVKAANNGYSCDKEAWLRVAISRAYYGVHVSLRKEMLQQGLINSKDLKDNQQSVHKFILDKLKEQSKFKIEYLAGQLLGYRISADYKDDFPAIDKASQNVKLLLEQFKKEFSELSFYS
jgi:uncharacterized protein (UPF0332 family)